MTQPASPAIAPIARRVIAYLIDAFIATGLAVVLIGAVVVSATLAGPEGLLGVLLIGGILVSVLLLAWLIVYTLMQAGRGSIGMRAQRLRLAPAEGTGSLGFGRALLRNVVFGLASAVVIGYVTPLFDGSGRFQGWHDKAAGALMLDAGAPHAPAIPDAAPSASATTAPVSAAAAPVTASPAPMTASPAPVVPAAPATSAAPAARPAPLTPAAPADAGALIAFVPGVSQDAVRAAPPVADAAADLDETVQGPAAARPPVPPPATTTAPEPEDVEDTRISIPGHRLVFTWDDGTRTSVSRRTIFGRNPTPEDGAITVPVRDETLSLSKTHFEAAAEASGGWVLDRHSTNGMTLVRDGQRIACPAGQRVSVKLGDAIEIGDRIVTIGGYA